MITVYALTYNEEVVLPYFIKHYRSRFPNCNIVIYDNYSTDKTVEIARKNNCEVIYHNTNNQMCDDLHSVIKNNCWKECKTEWCIVVDCDEFLEVDIDLLQNANFNVVKATLYEMYGEDGNIELINSGSTHGMWSLYGNDCSKQLCWKPKDVVGTNFGVGAHQANFIGNIKLNTGEIKCYHYKFISLDYVINRYKKLKERQSKMNIEQNWSTHYSLPESEIKKFYEQLKVNKISIPLPPYSVRLS